MSISLPKLVNPHELSTCNSSDTYSVVKESVSLPSILNATNVNASNINNHASIHEIENLPPFPQYGVSLEFLIQMRNLVIIEQEKNDSMEWTTTDVCSNLVMEWTREKQSSFHELMLSEYQTTPHLPLGMLSNEVIGLSPTIFVSHAWKYKFVELIDSIEQFIINNNNHDTGIGVEDTKKEDIFLWVDLFLNNQWRASSLPYEWWSSTFLSAIGKIGHVLLILQPWDSPIPLTRAWCLWEIICALKTNAKLSIHFSKNEKEKFQMKLREDFNYIMKAFCKIDVHNSESFNPTDKLMIFEAVEKLPGGFKGVNNQIADKMREWIADSARDLISNASNLDYSQLSILSSNTSIHSGQQHNKIKTKSQKPLTDEEKHKIDEMTDINRVAVLLRQQGKIEEAEQVE